MTHLSIFSAKSKLRCSASVWRPKTRKFTPHVTLARLRGSPPGRVPDFLTDHALYRSGAFEVEAFTLFSSVLTSDGSHYTSERVYPLR